ncbi:MAG: ABC transporter ATP-binding protein [Chloroflexota bacterium]
MGDFEVVALNKVSFEIKQGEFIAIMGPSGSGKSTIMNIIGCLDRPTAGEYFLDGQNVSDMDKIELAGIRNQQIGFVFQSFNLLSRTSALENVTIPLLYEKEIDYTDEETAARGKEVLESVGLGDRIEHTPNELSGGQRQRVAIARALVNNPVLLLADEPTGNLDSRSGEEIMRILEKLHNNGSTIVMVTHEEYIAAHADRVIRFFDGEVVKSRAPKVKKSGKKKPAKRAKKKAST